MTRTNQMEQWEKQTKKNEQENRIDIEYHLDLIQLEMLNHSLTNGLQFKLTLNIYVFQYFFTLHRVCVIFRTIR